MRRKLYDDAINVLQREIKERPEPESATRFLMLGECHYLLGRYAEARPWYAKAMRYLPQGKNRRIAEYRLACVAYRMADPEGALKQTDAYVDANPKDPRSGRLLLFKMKELAGRGRRAEAALQATRRQIASRASSYGAAVDLAADKILTDFYLQNDLSDKAMAGYMNLVNNFRKVTAEYAEGGRAVPAALEQSRDYAAMQLARIALRNENKAEAVKWLASIRFDQDLKQRGRLMLAQIAYADRDYRKAERYLLDGDFIETVPPGDLRSDMYLLLGFCAKRAANPTLEGVVKYFSRVAPDTGAYAQAQMGLADTYQRWRRYDLAVKAYERATATPKYEPEALSKLGELYLRLADDEENEGRKDELLELSAQRLSTLSKKYPGSPFARQSEENVKTLLERGKQVEMAVSDEARIEGWEQVVKEQSGTAEAARALISIARLHQKTVLNEKTGEFVKAPDYARCLEAANRLLNPASYDGRGLSEKLWRDLRAEALYYRALCHVSSLGREPGGDADSPAVTRYAADPDPKQALADLRRAGEMAGEEQVELKKQIEMLRVEAMFKSEDEALREQAEQRFHELVELYGNESRLQKLAIDIAEWHHEQGNFVEAAELYRGVAERGAAVMPQEDVVKLLFMAGKLYSKAAAEARERKTRRRYAIYIYPREVVAMAGLLKTHKPFQKTVRVDWPQEEVSAEQALVLLSRASGIPFVWERRGGKAPVDKYLKQKRVHIEEPSGTVASFLERLLDLEEQALAFDIGLTDGEPTLDPERVDQTDPEARAAARAVEIYRRADRLKRYGPMNRPYGAWNQVHSGSTMMFSVLERIEQIAETGIEWAEGVSKEDTQAREFQALPGRDSGQAHSCALTLATLLEPMGLTYRIRTRDLSVELYENAKECFNEIRRISPKTTYGEQSLFLLALNYYQREDYERMKIILQEYLKVFDSSRFDHYHAACFWVGWVFEREKRFRDACRYYERAAEEVLVVYAPPEDEPPPVPETLGKALGHETAYALEERVSGTFTNLSLAGSLQELVRLHAGVEIKLDASAVGIETNVNLGTVAEISVMKLLCDSVARMELALRPENLDPDSAEKAYYRMAVCYQNEGLSDRALASCRCLLQRYPGTRRRRDAYKLQLDIYKALKDYRRVLETLAALRGELAAEGLAYKIDYEMAWIYLDLCRYEEAARHFKEALGAAATPGERAKIRDGYARALLAQGELEDALHHYEVLVKEEPAPLRAFVDTLMVWYLRRATGKVQDDTLPEEASRVMRSYESLTDTQRGALPRSAYAKVTWVYYVSGLLDLHRGDADRALNKFDAAGNSPDDWLAARAIYRAAAIHRAAGRTDAARESLEYLLFSTKSAESEVKALFELAGIYRELGDAAKAEERLNRLVERFPDSSFAMRIRAGREDTAAGEDTEKEARRQEPAGEEPPEAEEPEGEGGREE